MPNQATFYGNIEEGDDFSQYSELELLTSALTLNNWKIDSHNNLGGGYNTFTISNGNISVNLHIYLKKVMWRHRNPDEKGIQFAANRITTGYEVVQDNNNITLMLGIYKREAYDDYLIVAWDPFEWGNLGKACNCFIDVHALAKAFQIGFSTDSLKLPRKVFSFKPDFIHYYITNKSFLHQTNNNFISNTLTDEIIIGFNKIYFGPPGTGKSHAIKEALKKLGAKGDNYSRVTFHPDYDYHSFVGGYKPFTDTEDDDKIKYKFVPQVFTDLYVRAWSNKSEDYYLVIEEINRGNCAEIFGDIFQLLDRNPEYNIEPSSELREYLVKKEEEINKENEQEDKDPISLLHNGKLQMPNNLSILASMNTSDQSLYPMDSAFKRRWDWEYIPICYNEKNDEGEENPSYHYEIDLGDGKKYKWINFISLINKNHIKDNPSLGMDKCIGNYFVKPLDGNIIELKPFINKVIFYLWNDVFKDEENKVFEKNTSYEDFFPISKNGLKKVKELFERIGLEPNPSELLYEDKDEGEELKEVAEEREPLA